MDSKNAIKRSLIILILFSALGSLAAASVVAEICTESGMVDANSAGVGMCNLGEDSGELLRTGTAEEVFARFSKSCTGVGYSIAPWNLLASPRLEVRMAAHLIQQDLASRLMTQLVNPLNLSPAETVAQVLTAASQMPAQYTDSVKAHVEEVFAHAVDVSDYNTYLDAAAAKADEICLVFLSPDCPQTFRDALKLSRVVGISKGNLNAAVTLADQTKLLFEDPRFSRGLAITALHVQDLILKAKDGRLPSTHLLEDLESGFALAGYDAATAEDLSYTFLAYYGTRGASMDLTTDLVTTENQAVMVASYIIASGMGVLDAYTVPTGHPYSLPATVHTDCSYGRPYHFWMAAALARELTKRGHSRRGSIIAAHVMGVAYEVFATSITRSAPWSQLASPSNSLGNNAIRVNIAMNDAGARWGGASGLGHGLGLASDQGLDEGSRFSSVNRPVDIDQRVETLIQASLNLPPLTELAAMTLYINKIKYAFRWYEVFMPNAGFSSLVW